jgi:uncharacterized membrane protein
MDTTVSGRAQRVVLLVDWLVMFIARHWLAMVNLSLAILVGLSVLAPLLMMADYTQPASLIYFTYQITCHQLPQRSFFFGGPKIAYSFAEIQAATGAPDFLSLEHHPLNDPRFGYQMAFCQRDFAIYAAMLLGGLLFALVKRWLKPPPFWLFLVLLIPIALDGGTQLIGLRESTWELRLFTGALFGLAIVWLAYPYIEWGMQDALKQQETLRVKNNK